MNNEHVKITKGRFVKLFTFSLRKKKYFGRYVSVLKIQQEEVEINYFVFLA